MACNVCEREAIDCFDCTQQANKEREAHLLGLDGHYCTRHKTVHGRAWTLDELKAALQAAAKADPSLGR